MNTINEQFNNELQRQIAGTMPAKHIYQLGHPGSLLRSIGIPDYPIELKASILSQKANDPRHPFHVGDVLDLPRAINDPLAVFSYGDSTKMINIIIEIKRDGKNFLVGISLNPTVKGEKLEIHSVRNVFPKDTIEWINWINQSKGLYFNKEEVLNLLDQQQINPADVAFGLPVSIPAPQVGLEQQAQQGGSKPKLSLSKSDISSAINIVKKFKNVNTQDKIDTGKYQGGLNPF
jgi:hypothetical protein